MGEPRKYGISSQMVEKFQPEQPELFRKYLRQSFVWFAMYGAAVVLIMFTFGFLAIWIWRLHIGELPFTLTMAFVGSVIVLLISLLMLNRIRSDLTKTGQE
jgi:uncharacterized membrane protein